MYIEVSGDRLFPSTIDPVCCMNILSNEDDTKAKEPVMFSSGDRYTVSVNSDSLGVSVLP